mgnify:CR=1 FL=1
MRINLDDDKMVEVTIRRQAYMYSYFIGDKRIGVFDPNVMEDNILILNNTVDNELADKIRDSINKMTLGEIEEEAQETEKIYEYMREKHDDEKIKDIRIIKLDDEKVKEEDKEKEESKEEADEKDEEENEEVDNKGKVDVKQTIDLDERANDMHDMRKWLGVPQDVAKIGVIESYQMSNLRDENGKSYEENSTRYSLVAIGKDGNVEPLSKYMPGLEQRDSSGNDPTRETYQVDNDGNVEKDAVLSEYQFGSKIIQIDNKETGRIEVNIGEEARNSTEAMGVKVRDSNTYFATDRSTRSVIGEYEENGENTVEENIEEADAHKRIDPEYKELNEEDIDGNMATSSHLHDRVVLESGEEITFEELATRWGLYEDGRPDAEHAREKYMEKQQEDLEAGPDEIIEELDEEYEDPRLQENQR